MPIKCIEILLARTWDQETSDEDNHNETAEVHALAATFPESIREVHVCDCNGYFLYFADGREG